jgi:hypothetical protein
MSQSNCNCRFRDRSDGASDVTWIKKLSIGAIERTDGPPALSSVPSSYSFVAYNQTASVTVKFKKLVKSVYVMVLTGF